MAARGAKPTPTHLRLVTGAHRTTRHGDAGKARAAVAKKDGVIVVKADGLAAGKGVTICASLGEARAALEAIFATAGDPQPGSDRPALAVVEERLYGLEASVIALCDGRDALALPAARDHRHSPAPECPRCRHRPADSRRR